MVCWIQLRAIYLSIDHLSIHLIPSILGSNLELKYPVFLFILAACLFSSRTPRLEDNRATKLQLLRLSLKPLRLLL